jgi:NAD-dependent dihydropyrimidine dehydrogenase PreA subunit
MKNEMYVNYTLGGKEWKPRFIKGIDKKLCSQCGICLSLCPANVFARTVKATIEALNKANCRGCACCEKMCKEKAIVCIPIEELRVNK